MSEQYEFMFGGKRYFIRSEMIDGLEMYLKERIPPGDFLRAILENDFVQAIGRADAGNLQNIQAYSAWLYNEAPMECWGSKEKVDQWLKAPIPEEVI